jgi:hypothetical protein
VCALFPFGLIHFIMRIVFQICFYYRTFRVPCWKSSLQILSRTMFVDFYIFIDFCGANLNLRQLS